MRRLALALLLLVGCSSNAGMPKFRSSRPPSLVGVGEALQAESVRVDYKALPWWTIAGTYEHFILGFDDRAHTASSGRRQGPIRSRDIPMSEELLDAVRCAWKIVPMGDPRPCAQDMERFHAMELAQAPIERAKFDLQEQAAEGGFALVGEVRCFAEKLRGRIHLWCEGAAFVPPDQAIPTVAGSEASTPILHEPRSAGTRLVLHADGSVGALGPMPIVGSSFGLRYRPLEFGFSILDLGREDQKRGLIGLGLTVLGRLALTPRVDAIAGVSALAVASNGATNPDFDGLYQSFLGVEYRAPWLLSGVAVPFVQLRGGAARGTDLASTITPLVELHLGFSTNEGR